MREAGITLPAEGGDPIAPGVSEARAVAEAIALGLLEKYAFRAAGTGEVLPIYGKPNQAMKVSAFVEKFKPQLTIEIGPRGGVTEHNPASIWRKHPKRIEVEGYIFDPMQRRGLVTLPCGARAINTYEPTVHTADPEGLELWHRFMVHLIHGPPDSGA
jgi:hypothetical protein